MNFKLLQKPAIVIGSLVLLAFPFVQGCGCTTVESGNVGIKLVWGEADPTPLPEGLHQYNAFSTDVVAVSTRIQKKEVKASASSKDLQVVSTKLALNYRLDPKHVVTIFKDVGGLRAVVSTIIDPAIQESTKKGTAMFTAEELITKREQAKAAITEDITKTLAKNHIVVTEVSITDFQFDAKYQNAVEAKQVAEQRAAQAKNDLERIKVEAQQAEAKAAGRASAMLVEAEAEAKAQELLRKTVTPEIVYLRAIEKWDGHQPQMVGQDGAIIDLAAFKPAPTARR